MHCWGECEKEIEDGRLLILAEYSCQITKERSCVGSQGHFCGPQAAGRKCLADSLVVNANVCGSYEAKWAVGKCLTFWYWPKLVYNRQFLFLSKTITQKYVSVMVLMKLLFYRVESASMLGGQGKFIINSPFHT